MPKVLLNFLRRLLLALQSIHRALLANLRKLIRLLIKRINHIPDMLQRIQRHTIRLVLHWLIIHHQTSRPLIQNTVEHLIQDHLTQLDFYLPDRLSDLLCDMSDLDPRVRFDDTKQILLQEGIVQCRKVVLDDGSFDNSSL